MTVFDWAAAEETVVQISRSEVREFLDSDRARNVYGVGLFCHNSFGDVLLVANSTEYHNRSFGEYIARRGGCDENEFKWQIGNWKYPAGISDAPGQESIA